MKVVVCYLFLVYCVQFLLARPVTRRTTQPPSTPPVAQTNLPDDQVELALNVDSGRYKTTRFHFQNHQNIIMEPRPQDFIYKNTCLRQFRKCLLGQTVATPVCSYHHKQPYWTGYITTNSYCDVYYENCRYEYRYWHILDEGKCQFQFMTSKDDVEHTRRIISKVPSLLLARIIQSLP